MPDTDTVDDDRPDRNGHFVSPLCRAFGWGNRGTPRADRQLAGQALRRFALSDEQRQVIVSVAMADLVNAQSVRDRMGAAKVLLIADSIDARRERTDVEARNGEIAAAARVLTSGLGTAEARARLAALSEEVCAPEYPAAECAQSEHISPTVPALPDAPPASTSYSYGASDDGRRVDGLS